MNSTQFNSDERKRYRSRLQELATTSRYITLNLPVEEVIQIIAERARLLIGAHQSVVSLSIDENWGQSIQGISLSEKYAQWRDYDEKITGKGIYALVCETNQPMRLTQEELISHPRWRSFSGAADRHPPLNGWLAAPLVNRDGSNMGLIQLSDKFAGEFTEEDEFMLMQLSHLSAVSIDNARLYTRVQRHTNELEARVAERTREYEHLNRRMATVLNNASDAILLITEDDMIDMPNPAFLRMFAYEYSDLFNEPFSRVIDPVYHDALHGAIRAVREGNSPQRLQAMGRRKDGTMFDIEISLASVSSNRSVVVCTIFDISRFKAVERLKDEFISTVNHEIRTPIASIVLGIGTLHRYYERLSDEKRIQRIAQVERQAKVIVELIDAILDLARFARQQEVPRDTNIDMCQLVTQLIDEQRIQAEHKNQTMTLDIPETSIIIAGEQMDFVRVWRNLLSNAIKYTPDNGSITVTLAEDSSESLPVAVPDDPPDTRYMIGHVADTGYGISPEDQANLFTRFYRGWAKSSDIPGTGLGLALVREILNLYGGDITVQSTPGEGTTFTFWLPVVTRA